MLFGAHTRALLGLSDCEHRVSQALATLPDTYLVLDGYRPHAADGSQLPWKVDHVVVCPSGVYAIDSRHCASMRLTASRPTAEAYAAQLATCQCRAGLQEILRPSAHAPAPTPKITPIVVCGELSEPESKARVAGPARCVPLAQLRHVLTLGESGSALSGALLAETARALVSRLSLADRRRHSAALARFTSAIQVPSPLPDAPVSALPLFNQA